MKDTKIYVIGVYGPPWVLCSHDTTAGAMGAIRWQGGQCWTDWAMARRTGPDTFKALYGPRSWTVERGPYTEAYWTAFLAEWEA